VTGASGTPIVNLERRLELVRRNLKASQCVLNLNDALSLYHPTQPTQFLWDPRLSSDERTLAGVHEMVHAVLHPPGSTPMGKNETPVEERIAHHVAGRACVYFGVTGYPVFLERWPDHTFDIEDDEREGVELLLAALVETLETPGDPPTWLDRGNYGFGIASLELAWAAAAEGSGQ